MTKNIAYFITPHGFGHASRATGVMQAIQQSIPEAHFTIFSTLPNWFFEESQIKAEVIPTNCDVGVVQKTPFIEDFEATLEQLNSLYPFSQELLSTIVKKLKDNQIDLVICDIAALGIAAAELVGLPSVLIENFTWDWIYEPFAQNQSEFTRFSNHLKSIYPQASLRIQTEPLCERVDNAAYITSPIARQPFSDRDTIRRKLGLSNTHPLVLMSMGGIQEEYSSVQQLKKYQDTTFIIPGGKDSFKQVENLIFLPHHSDFYHPDLIQAADFVIGKAGYSTIAEVYHAGIPFGFISRARSRETVPLANFIKSQIPSVEISEEQYQNETWLSLLPQIFELQPRHHSERNGAFDVIDILRNNQFL